MTGYRTFFYLMICLMACSISSFGQNPNWQSPDSENFSNTATLISIVVFDGVSSNNQEDRLAFFVDDEIRGLSQTIETENSSYLHFTTIYSNTSTEKMEVRFYHKDTDKVYHALEEFDFNTGGIYGSVDQPFEVNIYSDGNGPLSFLPIPDQITLEGIPFQSLDLDPYLIQEGNKEIEWSFTPNDDLNVTVDGGILNVIGVDGFAGSTVLTVRATQITTPMQSQGPQPLAPFMDNSFVETDINYIITPMYNGPAWNNIPPQSTILGVPFDPLNLHDYEYQYNGPAIQYDYLPLLIPAKTPDTFPSWEFIDLLEVNMTATIRMMYTPKYVLQHEDDLLSAFMDGDLRGVSRRDSLTGLHYLTIGGSPMEEEDITLKFYSGEEKKLYDIVPNFAFKAFDIIGSEMNPLTFDLSPFYPVVPDIPLPDGVASIPVEMIDTTYTGVQHFTFIAFDPLYPNVLKADTSTSYCIRENAAGLNTSYADFDGDGLGDPNISIESCDGVLNYVLNSDDCDDTNTIYCSDTVFVENDPGLCSASNVMLDQPTFDDCHVTSIMNDAPIDFPVGSTKVTWTLEFNETTTKTCIQIVVVEDTEAPVPVIGGSTLDWDEIISISAEDSIQNQQFGFSVDLFKEWAVVGAKNDDSFGPNSGAAYILYFDGDSWVEHSKIIASNGEKEDQFGYSVSISQNHLIVGAPYHHVDEFSEDKGAVYVFEYDGVQWSQSQILTASNASDNDLFGSAVSISNDHLIVGAYQEDTDSNNSGAAYVFEKKDTWVEQIMLKANDAEDDDNFGFSVAISGSNVVVGAPNEDTEGPNAGAAYIFEKDGILGTWSQKQLLLSNNGGVDFEYGTSVDISGDHVIVGAPGHSSNGLEAGAVFLYLRTLGQWYQEQTLIPVTLETGDNFGANVAISANYLAVGAPGKAIDNIEGGAAFIYKNENSLWGEMQMISASDNDNGDIFGASVAFFGHEIIVGNPSNDEGLSDIGKAYVFHLNSGLPINDSSCPITFDPPLALDNCDGEIIGILVETSDYVGLGLYEITWSYIDSSGNISYQFQFVQASPDTVSPELICPPQIELYLDGSGSLNVSLPDSLIFPSDNCGMVSLDYFPTSFDCSNLGLDTVTVIASDAMGNSTSCTIEVVVGEGPKIVQNLNNEGLGSLRYFIDGSCGGQESVIYFDTLLNGTIEMTPPAFNIDRDIEIIGLGKDIINIDANFASRVFEIDSTSNFILRNLQIVNGAEMSNGGAVFNRGTLHLDDVRFIGNLENGFPKAFTNLGEIKIVGGRVEVKE